MFSRREIGFYTPTYHNFNFKLCVVMVLAPTRHPRNGFSRELENYTGGKAARKPIPNGIFLCVFILNLESNYGQLPLIVFELASKTVAWMSRRRENHNHAHRRPKRALDCNNYCIFDIQKNISLKYILK